LRAKVKMDIRKYWPLIILRNLDILQTWYTGISWRVKITTIDSKVKRPRVKLDLGTYWPFNILRTHCWWTSNLIQWYILKSTVDDNYWYLRSKGQCSNWTLEETDHSISWERFAWRTSKLEHWYILSNQSLLLVLRSKVKNQTWNRIIPTAQYLKNLLLDRGSNLIHWHSHIRTS
jgi:hypothetical protein